MHQNLDKLEDFEVNMYIISSDFPEQQTSLHGVFEESFGESLTFVTDSELEMNELFGMRNLGATAR